MVFVWQKLKVWSIAFLLCQSLLAGESIRLATYNLNNYLVMDRTVKGVWRKSYPKPESEKAAIRKVIRQVMPDVLAIQEIGPHSFLKELKADLAQEGVVYPHSVHMPGDDPVRHLAILAKIAPVEVVQHQDLAINYQNRDTFVKRGMLELSFARPDGSIFKLFVVHLKSRRTNVKSDPKSQERRTLEAEACRDRIIERTFDMNITNFVIAGDFNDHPESAPLRRFYNRGELTIGALVPIADSREESWTHYYKREEVYSMVDGFIVSALLFPRIENMHGHINDTPGTLEGSDHRMVYLDIITE